MRPFPEKARWLLRVAKGVFTKHRPQGDAPTETKTEQCGSQKLKTVLRESLIALRCAMPKAPFAQRSQQRPSCSGPPGRKGKGERPQSPRSGAAAGAARNTKPQRSDKTVQVPSAAKVAKARGVSFAARRAAAWDWGLLPPARKRGF